MQNVWKLSNRNMFHYKINYFNYLHKHLVNSNNNFRQCFNQERIYRFFGSVSQNSLTQIQREYRVVHSMLVHTLFGRISKCKLDYYRYFSNESTKLKENNPNESSINDPNKKKKNSDEQKEENLFKLKLCIMLTILSTIIATLMHYVYLPELRQEFGNDKRQGIEDPREISWNEFVHQFLSKGEIKEIIIIPEIDYVKVQIHPGAVVKGQKTRAKSYMMHVPDAIKIEERIREAESNLGIKPGSGIPIVYQRGDASGFLLVITLLAIGLFWVFIKKHFPEFRSMSPKFYSHMTQAKFTLVDPLTGKGKGVKFSDVAGLREAKIEIMEFVDYLKRPDHYKILGAKLPKGTLLLGPPGCGKTLLAKAVATEANVPFLSMNGSEFTEVVGGLGAARIRNLFNEAKKRAPSIIYIDEIDTIGRKRLDSHFNRSTDESEQTLNQLLTEMDGMETRQNVIVLASTNRSMVLDKALLRRGRFDRHILIDYPDIQERKEIFELHLKKLNLDHEPSENSEKLASLTSGNTGADIANMCNEAALRAARLKKSKVEFVDLLWAVERILLGSEKINSTILEHEKRIIAFHEAGHALVNWLLESMDDLHKVSIVQRTNNKLGTSTFKENVERKINSQQEMEDWICCGLAGRVAENLTFNVVTTSAKDDLQDVVKTAYMLVRQMGMNKTIGLVSFTDDQISGSRKFYSKMLDNLMDQEVRLLLTRMYKRTRKLLITNNDKLKLLAEALLEKESLTYEEVQNLIGPREFKQKTNVLFNVNKEQY